MDGRKKDITIFFYIDGVCVSGLYNYYATQIDILNYLNEMMVDTVASKCTRKVGYT